MMEIKQQYMLREIVGDYVLVPTGSTVNDFNGLIILNEVARFIWENYEKAKDEDELLGFILDEYEVEKDVAKADLNEFLDILRKNEIV